MSIGFKEWAIVCEALKSGRQSLIIRKGGIAEGREGFRFEHSEFLLFPTLFHEQIERTTLPPDTALPASTNGTVRIETLARVEWTCLVDDLSSAAALATFHILKPSVIEERFHYDEPKGVNVAVVRIYRLSAAWDLPMVSAYGGCRSWVKLPDPPPNLGLTSVLTDAEHQERIESIRGVLRMTAALRL